MRIFLTPILEFEFFLCYLCQNIKILQKKIFDWAIIGGGTIFLSSPRTMGNEKKFCARSKFFFIFSSIMDPKYDPILVF